MLRFLVVLAAFLTLTAAPAAAQLPGLPTGGPTPDAYQAQRRQRLPRHPAARHPRALQRGRARRLPGHRRDGPALLRPARRCTSDLVYATPGLTAAQHPEVLQGLELRRARRPGRADLLAARRRHDRARQGLRRAARLRHDPRRRDVRPRLRRRRGPPVLHGRAAPRRARASCRASPAARNTAMDARAVGGRALHGARPRSARSTSADEPLRRRGRTILRATSTTTSRASTSTSPRRRLDPTKMPGEYAAIGHPLGPDLFKRDRPDRDRRAGRRRSSARAAARSSRGRRSPTRSSKRFGKRRGRRRRSRTSAPPRTPRRR